MHPISQSRCDQMNVHNHPILVIMHIHLVVGAVIAHVFVTEREHSQKTLGVFDVDGRRLGDFETGHI